MNTDDYEVTYNRADSDLKQRKRFDSKAEALIYARTLNVLLGVPVSNIELWFTQKIRHNITEAIHIDNWTRV